MQCTTVRVRKRPPARVCVYGKERARKRERARERERERERERALVRECVALVPWL